MNKIFSVSEATSLIKNKLENEIPSMYVEGEISEFKQHGSGHQYFTIKDNKSILSCIVWRSTAKKLATTPKVGMNVVLFGRLNVYSPQGRYS
nr:exodeoxyribonuclease VII large subunit [Candidatus Neomarinimicrobiota bacterium]